MLEQRLHQIGELRLDTCRPGDDERPGAARELRVQQQERQAAKMVAMEMRDQDQVDVVAHDAEAFQRGQRRRAAIDQEIDAVTRDVEAGVEPAAGTERVAAADKSQLHRPQPYELDLSPARGAE